MKLRDKNPALILIDIQKAFEDENLWGGNRNNKDAEKRARQVREKWRELELPVRSEERREGEECSDRWRRHW